MCNYETRCSAKIVQVQSISSKSGLCNIHTLIWFKFDMLSYMKGAVKIAGSLDCKHFSIGPGTDISINVCIRDTNSNSTYITVHSTIIVFNQRAKTTQIRPTNFVTSLRLHNRTYT